MALHSTLHLATWRHSLFVLSQQYAIQHGIPHVIQQHRRFHTAGHTTSTAFYSTTQNPIFTLPGRYSVLHGIPQHGWNHSSLDVAVAQCIHKISNISSTQYDSHAYTVHTAPSSSTYSTTSQQSNSKITFPFHLATSRQENSLHSSPSAESLLSCGSSLSLSRSLWPSIEVARLLFGPSEVRKWPNICHFRLFPTLFFLARSRRI